jgi:AcrR family transcriptional regulator
MSSEYLPGSPRRAELLDACYGYLLDHGLAGLSLRPLAAATGTSPRVLLYLFGSKENLVRDLLARARREQIALVASALDPATAGGRFDAVAGRLWSLLSAPEQRAMVRLTYEAFLRSVSRDPGPWQGYAAETARDWLELLIRAQPDMPREAAEANATRTLALIRGLLLDLLASEDPGRVAAAVQAGRWQHALSRRPASASPARRRLPGLGQLAGGCCQAVLVCGFQVAELVPELCDDVAVGLHRDGGAFVGEGHEGGPPVVRVAGADEEPSLFEAVDEVAQA